jgi:hypothetical protein
MIWRPHAFGPTGTPITPQAPPELRIEGGVEPSSLTRNHAQQAFAQFCTDARLSNVPNPTRTGKLPDGTPYRIVTVGPQTIMQIWPQPGDDDRFSGIAITLVHLDGTPIPGHVDEDGTPITYLLTPQLEGKTRKSNGKWKVRKPKNLAGGKAVNPAKDGLLYYTGIDGESDMEIPFTRNPGYGVNGLAYDDEGDGPGALLFKSAVNVGRSRDNPIPFIYQKGDVRTAMQLQFISDFVDDHFENRVELWVSSTGLRATGVICDTLVDSQILPAGRILDPESITFKDDGTQARITGQAPGGLFGFYTIHLTPAGFSISLDSTQARDRVAGTLWRHSYKSTSSGTPGVEGTYTYTADEINGTQPPTEDYGATEPFEGSGDYNVVGQILGEVDFYNYGPDSYKFDRRGQPVSDAGDRRRVHVSGYSTRHVSETVVLTRLGPFLYTADITNIGIQHREKTDIRYGSFGSATLVDSMDDWEIRSHTFLPDAGEPGSGETELEVTGQGHSYTNSSGPAPIFEDDELEFSVYYDIQNMRRQEWTWKLMPETSQGYGRDFTMDQITYESTLKVKCKGTELLSVDVDLQGFKRHVVFIASDPMTGAILVNIQEVHSSSREKYRSWIFLVDDKGGKALSSVLKDLPTNARAVRNASIFSV